MNNEKQAYQQKIAAQIAEWEAEIELLKAKSKNLAADAKLEFEQQLSELEKNKSQLSAYLSELADKADDAWEDVKDEAEKKWNKLSEAFECFITKLKE
ncbi:MAG: coiled coil domain-containing protein [Nitrosomonas sp. PRO4]|nr:coiled coil domain-containing protein [Nitrosomonas sp. PRO4]TXI20318.1 MAG: coiled coil domain-containing protein [Nitrosomonas sp.]